MSVIVFDRDAKAGCCSPTTVESDVRVLRTSVRGDHNLVDRQFRKRTAPLDLTLPLPTRRDPEFWILVQTFAGARQRATSSSQDLRARQVSRTSTISHVAEHEPDADRSSTTGSAPAEVQSPSFAGTFYFYPVPWLFATNLPGYRIWLL